MLNREKLSYSHRYIGAWINSQDISEQILGWSIVIKLAKNNSNLPDGFFNRFLVLIKQKIWQSDYQVQQIILDAIMAIANRNLILLNKVNKVLKEITSNYYFGN